MKKLILILIFSKMSLSQQKPNAYHLIEEPIILDFSKCMDKISQSNLSDEDEESKRLECHLAMRDSLSNFMFISEQTYDQVLVDGLPTDQGLLGLALNFSLAIPEIQYRYCLIDKEIAIWEEKINQNSYTSAKISCHKKREKNYDEVFLSVVEPLLIEVLGAIEFFSESKALVSQRKKFCDAIYGIKTTEKIYSLETTEQRIQSKVECTVKPYVEVFNLIYSGH